MYIIYSKNNCPGCAVVKAKLINQGLTYEEANIDENPLAKIFLVTEGYRSVPQVFKDDVNVTKEFI